MQTGCEPGYATRRWVEIMGAAIESAIDPRTMTVWSRLVGISVPGIVMRCRAADMSPRRSLELSRITRALLRGNGRFENIQEHLDVVDMRTVDRLLKRAGLSRTTAFDPATLPNSFFIVQTLVPHANPQGVRCSAQQLEMLAARLRSSCERQRA